MPRARRIVLAFGGNALIGQGQEGTQWEQLENARSTAEMIVPLVRDGHDLVIVHGNGPQVGNILIQVEEAVTKIPPLSLDVCVAASEGSIGYMLEVALLNALRRFRLRRGIVTFVSEVVVDPKDPGFRRPTKPIGPFYTRYRADFLMHKQGWNMIEDSGRGWRKVVPSPRPIEVVQMLSIRGSVDAGNIVIAGGGGGIPVYHTEGGELRGVEAVIDKDYTAGLIAAAIKADLLVILTSVDQVYLNFGRPNRKGIGSMDTEEARAFEAEGQFPEGSMGPKVRAGIEFVDGSGGEALITSSERLAEAVLGRAGTRIVPRLSGTRSTARRTGATKGSRRGAPQARRRRAGPRPTRRGGRVRRSR